jgi:hypothetical protein
LHGGVIQTFLYDFHDIIADDPTTNCRLERVEKKMYFTFYEDHASEFFEKKYKSFNRISLGVSRSDARRRVRVETD